MSRATTTGVRDSLVRAAALAVFAGAAWSATAVAAQAVPADQGLQATFVPREVNPSGPLDPRCILAQGNPICANGPWVADPNATPNPLPSGPSYNPMDDPSNPADPQSMLNPANPLSPMNPTSPTNPMNSIPSTPTT